MVINVARQMRRTDFATKDAIAIALAGGGMAGVKIGANFFGGGDADGGGQNIVERNH